jgi:hypothetical protein
MVFPGKKAKVYELDCVKTVPINMIDVAVTLYLYIPPLTQETRAKLSVKNTLP